MATCGSSSPPSSHDTPAGGVAADDAAGAAIVLAGGQVVDAAFIEAHYRCSPYIQEICVVGWPREVAGGAEGLYAVVVPDRARLEARRMVNAGEIVRFELENRSVGLPPHQRIAAYAVTMTTLPRTPDGLLDREMVERGVRQAGAGSSSDDVSETERAWMASEEVAPLLEEIRAAAREGSFVRPGANLELDLGIDSLARVELMTALEHRAGSVVPGGTTACLFTVREIVDAVLQGRTGAAGRQEFDAWASLLSDEPATGRSPDDLRLAGGDRVVWLFHVAVRALLFLSRAVVKYEVSGTHHLPARGPYLLCPNHQSYLDPFVLAGHLPFTVVRQQFHVGATEYLQSPLTAWAARQVRLLPVDPDNGLLPALRASAHGLRAGRVLVLFPEGERSIDGTVRPFKTGVAVLASHLGVPVVPVGLDGLFELWPRSRPFAWRHLLPWRRHRVSIRIGPPLVPEPLGRAGGPHPRSARAALGAFADRLRAAVAALRA